MRVIKVEMRDFFNEDEKSFSMKAKLLMHVIFHSLKLEMIFQILQLDHLLRMNKNQ